MQFIYAKNGIVENYTTQSEMTYINSLFLNRHLEMYLVLCIISTQKNIRSLFLNSLFIDHI